MATLENRIAALEDCRKHALGDPSSPQQERFTAADGTPWIRLVCDDTMFDLPCNGRDDTGE